MFAFAEYIAFKRRRKCYYYDLFHIAQLYLHQRAVESGSKSFSFIIIHFLSTEVLWESLYEAKYYRKDVEQELREDLKNCDVYITA
jgi:hypothetical protein